MRASLLLGLVVLFSAGLGQVQLNNPINAVPTVDATVDLVVSASVCAAVAYNFSLAPGATVGSINISSQPGCPVTLVLSGSVTVINAITLGQGARMFLNGAVTVTVANVVVGEGAAIGGSGSFVGGRVTVAGGVLIPGSSPSYSPCASCWSSTVQQQLRLGDLVFQSLVLQNQSGVQFYGAAPLETPEFPGRRGLPGTPSTVHANALSIFRSTSTAYSRSYTWFIDPKIMSGSGTG